MWRVAYKRHAERKFASSRFYLREAQARRFARFLEGLDYIVVLQRTDRVEWSEVPL